MHDRLGLFCGNDHELKVLDSQQISESQPLFCASPVRPADHKFSHYENHGYGLNEVWNTSYSIWEIRILTFIVSQSVTLEIPLFTDILGCTRRPLST